MIGIQPLTVRRLRGDLIQIYKCSNDVEEIQFVNKPDFKCDTRTRGHSKRYKKELIKNCNARYHFLTNRAEKYWNKLPEKAVLAPTINTFKSSAGSFFGWP